MVSPVTSDSSQMPETSTPTLTVHTASASSAGYPHKDFTAADHSTTASKDNPLLDGTQGAVSSQIVSKPSQPMELDHFAATACDLLHPTAFIVKSHSVLENFSLDLHMFDCIEN